MDEDACLRDLEGVSQIADAPYGFSWDAGFSAPGHLPAASPTTTAHVGKFDLDGSIPQEEYGEYWSARSPIVVGICGPCYFIAGHGHRELSPRSNPDDAGISHIANGR